jgi:DnaA family protein
MTIDRQFPLDITLDDGASFDNFFNGGNGQLVAAIRSCCEGGGEQFLFLWANQGTGKTHLLQAACRLAGELNRSAAYVPFTMAPQLSTEMLLGLEEMDLVCLDDIQLVAGNEEWEQALFHLFNRIRERNGRLIIAADRSPSALHLQMPDLTSRLSWGPAYRLLELEEKEKIAALVDGAKRRGMELTTDAACYIFKHYRRDMGSLLTLVDKLDRASLAAQRRPTIQFIRTILDDQ